MKTEITDLSQKDLIKNTEEVLTQVLKLWRNEDSLFNSKLRKAVRETELSILNLEFNNEKN